MLERAKRASHIDPPASSYAIMQRASPYCGENPGPGKDVHGELDPTPGIREQPRTASRRKVKVSLGLHPYLPALRLPFSLSPPQGSNWRQMSAKSPTHGVRRVNKTSQRASRKIGRAHV